MNSFAELFNKILEDTSKWDYYNNTYGYYNNYQVVLNNSKYFIESILSDGKKLSDLTRHEYKILEDGYRLEHTVSLYFMGIIIYENVSSIRESIDNYIRQVDRHYSYGYSRFMRNQFEYENDTPFSYFWFLICFFHDFGYSFEMEDKSSALERIFNVLDGNLNFVLPNGFYKTGVPKVISDNIQNYINYRYKVNNKLDHGIVSGLLFWEERKKDYYNRQKKHKEEAFIEDNRLWSKAILYNIHLPVAWTISAHNVWFIEEHSEYAYDYKKYGLDRLIIDKPKIRIDRHPMLFLLSIVDTLDPVKLLLSCDVHKFDYSDLNLIWFEFSHDSILYRINFNDTIVNERYRNSIKNIDAWLCCKSYYNNGIFEIRI